MKGILRNSAGIWPHAPVVALPPAGDGAEDGALQSEEAGFTSQACGLDVLDDVGRR